MNKNTCYIVAATTDVPQMESEFRIEAKNNVAEIRISGPIDRWENSAAQFRLKVDELLAQGVKDFMLYLNTPGGSVFEANEIANEIRRFPGTRKGKGGAIVASAGSYLAVICDEFEMAENGQFMYHKPIGYLSGNEDAIGSSLKLLKNFTIQYRTAYAEKTTMSEDDIEANWAKGDVWLSAQEALAQGFITGISKPAKITKESQALFVACGSPVIPEINTQSEQIEEHNMKNRNQIIAALKLSADATDEQIEEAIKASMEKSNQVDQLKEKSEKDHKASVETYVDAAILAKKITADDKTSYVALGVADFDAVKAILDKKPALEKLSNKLEKDKDGKDVRADWKLQDYIDKDPEALEKLIIEDPQKFEALQADHYGN